MNEEKTHEHKMSGLVNESYISPDIRHEFAMDIPHVWT
jgi:hypothetical protein